LAIKCYDEAIRLDPKDYAAWHNKGNALMYLGKYDEAIEAWDEVIKVIRLNPNDTWTAYDAWTYAYAWSNKVQGRDLRAVRDLLVISDGTRSYSLLMWVLNMRLRAGG
jgi:tetratricopeptide (TPR) repeat protein